MQVPTVFRIAPKITPVSVPPMYQWPQFLRKAILTLAIGLCAGFYLVLAAGLISMLALALSAVAR